MDGKLENTQSLTGKIKALEIDKTLSKQGMCAEAKATGDALAKKVNISDIVDDLTTEISNKPLSANQGRLLKNQIDEIDPHYAENVIYNNADSGIDSDNVQGAIDNVQGAIDDVVRTIGYSVSKNLLAYPYYETTKEGKGIAYTDIGDGTIRANGTATSNIGFNMFYRLGKRLTLKAGTYIYNGCPKGGSESTYFMDIGKVSNDLSSVETIAIDIGEGATFTLEEESELAVSIVIMSGTPINNLLFKPMISKEGGEFEPYVADVKTQIDDRYSHNTSNIAFPFTAPHSGILTLAITRGESTEGICGALITVTSLNGFIRYHHCMGWTAKWGAISFQIPVAKGDVVVLPDTFSSEHGGIYAERTYFTY